MPASRHKTHLLIALGTLAAEAGYRVRYILASKLVNELVEAADDKQLTKLINRYGRVDLIPIDLSDPVTMPSLWRCEAETSAVAC